MWLDEWLFKERKTQIWLANETGVDRSYINQIVIGKKVPGFIIAKKIEIATRGEITVEEIILGDMRERGVRQTRSA